MPHSCLTESWTWTQPHRPRRRWSCPWCWCTSPPARTCPAHTRQCPGLWRLLRLIKAFSLSSHLLCSFHLDLARSQFHTLVWYSNPLHPESPQHYIASSHIERNPWMQNHLIFIYRGYFLCYAWIFLQKYSGPKASQLWVPRAHSLLSSQFPEA